MVECLNYVTFLVVMTSCLTLIVTEDTVLRIPGSGDPSQSFHLLIDPNVNTFAPTSDKDDVSSKLASKQQATNNKLGTLIASTQNDDSDEFTEKQKTERDENVHIISPTEDSFSDIAHATRGNSPQKRFNEFVGKRDTSDYIEPNTDINHLNSEDTDRDLHSQSGELAAINNQNDNDDKRSYDFVGKKRYNFIGKRYDFVGKRYDFVGKRYDFLGKRSPYNFLGKRYDFLGKRKRYDFLGKRSYDFLGKRSPYEFVGKRSYDFLGKRSPYEFVGKRSPYEFVGKRNINDDDLKDALAINSSPSGEHISSLLYNPKHFITAPGVEATNKRYTEFLGKRKGTEEPDEAILSHNLLLAELLRNNGISKRLPKKLLTQRLAEQYPEFIGK